MRESHEGVLGAVRLAGCAGAGRRDRIRRGMCTLFLATLLALATSAVAQTSGAISTVSPNSAAQGTSNLTVTFTLASPPPVPPAGTTPTGVTIGAISGTSVTHSSQYTVTAVFAFSCTDSTGAQDCSVSFSTPNGTVTYAKTGGFTVTEGSGCHTPPTISAQPQSQTVSVGDSASLTVVASGSATLRYQWQKGTTDITAATSATYTISSASAGDAGSYRCVVTNDYGSATSDAAALTVDTSVQVTKAAYPVVDTAQTSCYNASTSMTCPSSGQSFYGQDAQFTGYAPRFSKSADGLTVNDLVTGLTWQHTTDTNGDGTIDSSDKKTYAQATAWPAALNAESYGGFSDWRLPSIKELYSLIDFRGTDPSGLSGTDTSGLTPFIDRTYFDFAYGDTSAGERIIDSQYASSTLYVSTAYGQDLFGVNFADGRIKGYGLTINGLAKTFFVQCVRGNTSYGINSLADNGDQTITDRATGLMWAKSDSGSAMNWQDALAWVQTKNSANYLGYSDWRLPNTKELESIVDYARSPDTSGSAAIDAVFNVTSFTGELCTTEYPWYWASTTHAAYNGSGASGAYVCFGRAMGYMSAWSDVHGAGAQRSDPKSGSLSSYTYVACGYYNSIAPQGDAVRITNYVRLVRGGAGPLRTSFAYSPASPTDATAVTFTGSASGGTSPYSYSWDLDGSAATGSGPSKTFGSGAHTIVMTVTDAAGLVTRSTQTIAVAPSVTAPPPVADGKRAGTAARFTKDPNVPGQIDVAYGTSPCSGSKAVILYGNLGSYSGYADCAQSDAGNAGTATIAAPGLSNVWFNVVWVNGSTAGHPGYAFDGTSDVERTWNASRLCGITADDHSNKSCD